MDLEIYYLNKDVPKLRVDGSDNTILQVIGSYVKKIASLNDRENYLVTLTIENKL